MENLRLPFNLASIIRTPDRQEYPSCPSDVEVADVECVVFDELTTRLDRVTH
jgi:hypothetical protein